ncbi:nuclear transport factor 2 family protein [Allomuricauda sp. SCSIO 65647]|uniref:nuclear transport factor 2 family protein n=1 Tax=Allomuricauda sp. SCSIO 65647 TaxID=2908843 RepID=UPI001F32C397|nr:nuclear transport factor 2 family protein [Muricauda sp. SCSIO 65647]UJH67809.1 nuclear transport factor 2 family protein [Muricauda sp. SCSIO 65647]
MVIKKLVFSVLLLTFAFSSAQESKVKIKQVAAQFVRGADVQDGELLKEVLEPKSLQYVLVGGKLNTFSAKEYIKMVNDKQLGGKPRKITYRHAEFLGKNLAVVVLNAVSEEYDFLYQLSMTKLADGKWEIVGVTAEINGV